MGGSVMNKYSIITLCLLLVLLTGCSGASEVPSDASGGIESVSSEASGSSEGEGADDHGASPVDGVNDEVGSTSDDAADDEASTDGTDAGSSSSPETTDEVTEVEPTADPRRSAGCGRTDFNPAEGERFLEVGGDNRRYQVRMPENYDPARAYPMLFSLHGLNETGDTPMRQFENVITDDGIEVFPDGEGEQWNYTTDMVFIDALLTELQGEYCVDPARVFAAGFSAGGGGVHAIGCFLGDRFRGIAALAGKAAMPKTPPKAKNPVKKSNQKVQISFL